MLPNANGNTDRSSVRWLKTIVCTWSRFFCNTADRQAAGEDLATARIARSFSADRQAAGEDLATARIARSVSADRQAAGEDLAAARVARSLSANDQAAGEELAAARVARSFSTNDQAAGEDFNFVEDLAADRQAAGEELPRNGTNLDLEAEFDLDPHWAAARPFRRIAGDVVFRSRGVAQKVLRVAVEMTACCPPEIGAIPPFARVSAAPRVFVGTKAGSVIVVVAWIKDVRTRKDGRSIGNEIPVDTVVGFCVVGEKLALRGITAWQAAANHSTGTTPDRNIRFPAYWEINRPPFLSPTRRT